MGPSRSDESDLCFLGARRCQAVSTKQQEDRIWLTSRDWSLEFQRGRPGCPANSSPVDFSKESRLCRAVSRRQRFLIFPNASNSGMVLKILPYAGKMLHEGYSKALQFSAVADSG